MDHRLVLIEICGAMQSNMYHRVHKVEHACKKFHWSVREGNGRFMATVIATDEKSTNLKELCKDLKLYIDFSYEYRF